MKAAARRLLLIAAAAAAAAAVDATASSSSSSSSSSVTALLRQFGPFNNPLLVPSASSTGVEPGSSTPRVPAWYLAGNDLQFTFPALLKRTRLLWSGARKTFVVPALWAAVAVCLVMSVMLLIEALSMSAVSLYVKLFQRTPQKRYKWVPIGGEDGGCGGVKEKACSESTDGNAGRGEVVDLESGTAAAGGGGGNDSGSYYPMVLVQIPMYNEKEVYKLSIGAACALTWPPNRIIIQVLDDSTDPVVKI